MAGKSTIDSFANIAAVSVTEVTAGVLAYTKFNFPFSILDKIGLIISRIEYWPTITLNLLNSTTDSFTMGLIAATSIVDIANQADPGILDTSRVMRIDFGTAASAIYVNNPWIKDFSALPGGGILTAPSPLSAAVQSSGAQGAMSAWIKLFYTYKELTTEEYWQLVESRRIITS